MGSAPRRHPRRLVSWDALDSATGGSWAIYAFDTTERVAIGHSEPRESTAVGQTEVECVREMSRVLRVIAEGGAPK